MVELPVMKALPVRAKAALGVLVAIPKNPLLSIVMALVVEVAKVLGDDVAIANQLAIERRVK